MNLLVYSAIPTNGQSSSQQVLTPPSPGSLEEDTMPRKTVYVPRFGSSQRSDPELDQTQTSCVVQAQGDTDRNKRVRKSDKNILKVKFPKLGKKTEQTKRTREEAEDECTLGAACVLEPRVNTSFGPYSASVNTDVFLFSQNNSTRGMSEKEKAKVSVLRNISRMREENRLIRQRLVFLSQADYSSTQ